MPKDTHQTAAAGPARSRAAPQARRTSASPVRRTEVRAQRTLEPTPTPVLFARDERDAPPPIIPGLAESSRRAAGGADCAKSTVRAWAVFTHWSVEVASALPTTQGELSAVTRLGIGTWRESEQRSESGHTALRLTDTSGKAGVVPVTLIYEDSQGNVKSIEFSQAGRLGSGG